MMTSKPVGATDLPLPQAPVGPRGGVADLAAAELLRRVVGLHRRELVAPLLEDGLLGFLWHGEWPEHGSPAAGRVTTARELLRWLAGTQVPLHAGQDYAAVMRYLFIARRWQN